MAAACGAIGYTVSSLAQELHKFPHRNRNLKTVSNEFDPTDFTYLEGAFFSAGLFLLIGAILMLFIMVYLCARACCCTSKPGSGEGKQGCNPIFMIGCIVVCGGGLVLGYYGNEFTRTGIMGVSDAINSANSTVLSATSRVNEITANITGTGPTLEMLRGQIMNTTLPPAVKTDANRQISEAINQLDTASDSTALISSSLDSVPNVAQYTDSISKYDDIRWKSTIGALCYVLLILLIAFLCIICRSVGFLQLNVFLTLIALLVMWLYGGIFIGVGVLTGDFCVDPNGYVESAISNSSREQIRYFTLCGNCSNPFQSDFDNGRANLMMTQEELANLTADIRSAEDNSTEDALNTLGIVSASLRGVDTVLINLYSQDINCTNLNTDYNDLLTSACGKTLDGATFTFAGCFVLGVTLTVFIIAMQLYWTRLRDDQDGW